MIDFPTATAIHRRLPKDAFYKRLPLTKALKEKFVSEVERIVVENSLTQESLNLTTDSNIKEIILLSITLKKQEIDGKVIEAIARQNPHKLVFMLIYEDSRQLALYHGKLYRTQWTDAVEVDLKLRGFSLNEIWEAFVEQIALRGERAENAAPLSVDERLARQEQIQKLEKLITKIEYAAWKEQQPKKRFELYSRLREHRSKLEDLKNRKNTLACEAN